MVHFFGPYPVYSYRKSKQIYTYMGSVVSSTGGIEDVKARLPKARVAFLMLKIWKSNSRCMKLRILNSNVVSVLLYGSETW